MRWCVEGKGGGESWKQVATEPTRIQAQLADAAEAGLCSCGDASCSLWVSGVDLLEEGRGDGTARIDPQILRGGSTLP